MDAADRSVRDGGDTGAAAPDPATDPLWTALAAHDFDDPDADLPFSARLARENRWPAGYTAAVIDEYRRFCYLAMRAGHPVTPSDAVDQAWHLHLIHSAAYRDFCDGVLGGRLDHGPTRGGRNEQSKFRGWYADTLATYATVFGAPPPPEIWPPRSARFADADRFVRVNAARHWIVPRLRRGPAMMLIVGIAGLILIWTL